MSRFDEEYKKLNKSQKEAVDTTEGPVMVVAGPGTGKTQVLALRIGNILKRTDTKADGILCLTFTNSAVRAMEKRLLEYIGPEASKVRISTFHGFAIEMLEKYFGVLGLEESPKLLDEQDAILVCDRILESRSWQYIRPRSDTTRYFRDLKSLISILKRERINPENFSHEIDSEIQMLQNDPENISSRGGRKGELKKEVEKKIEGLERTREAVEFYALYEKEKIQENVMDYDDVLEALVKIIEESETAREEIKEEFLYVLVDEHQDSSGVQNEFLRAVWGETEKPNIFVVGDDRQLIYGFGGASLEYFENFRHTFGDSKLITLTENYRSSQKILDASHALLQSALVNEKLVGQNGEGEGVRLVAAEYPRDEIIAAGLEIKEMLKGKHKIDVNNIAVLVPKNKQVRSAITILKDMGLEVSGGENMDFFESSTAQSFIRVLKILAHPSESAYLGESFFDPISMVPALTAHKFLSSREDRDFSLLTFAGKKTSTLFGESEAEVWIDKLLEYLKISGNTAIYSFVQKLGSELLLDTADDHDELIERIEVLRTILHLLLVQVEKNPKVTLSEFVAFLDRLEHYGERISLAIFKKDEGIKVMTLHASKGLEFDFVWIAHLDEKSLAGGRSGGFTLPESIKARMEEKDEEVLKRQLYVAITRARKLCILSYAENSYTGASQDLAKVVLLLDAHLIKQSAQDTESTILAEDPKSYIRKENQQKESVDLAKLVKMVAKEYEEHTVSVSLLNNFFECPWKWYFRNLLKLPEEKTTSLEFGNAVHETIDEILKTGKLPKDKIYSALSPDEAKNVSKIAEAWFHNRLPEIAKSYKNEESVSYRDEQVPNLQVYGKIDLIEILKDGGVKVTDFKTGGGRKKSEIEKLDDEGRMSDYMRQLAMYSYLLTKNPKWKKEVVESTLEFLEAKKEEDKFYRTVIGEDKIEMLVQDIKDYDRLLQSGEWINRPCNFKSYGRANATCDYCAMAEIYKN